MAIGKGEQIESHLSAVFLKEDKPWSEIRKSNKQNKAHKHRRERRRVKEDPDCIPEYRKYKGYEF